VQAAGGRLGLGNDDSDCWLPRLVDVFRQERRRRRRPRRIGNHGLPLCMAYGVDRPGEHAAPYWARPDGRLRIPRPCLAGRLQEQLETLEDGEAGLGRLGVALERRREEDQPVEVGALGGERGEVVRLLEEMEARQEREEELREEAMEPVVARATARMLEVCRGGED
jgi:hypothetical protein